MVHRKHARNAIYASVDSKTERKRKLMHPLIQTLKGILIAAAGIGLGILFGDWLLTIAMHHHL